MTKRLDDIAARVEAATPGPWNGRIGIGNCDYIVKAETSQDADLIANAPADLRYLLAIARAAERLAASGFRNHVCGGAWEPLQHGETPEGRGRCCPFCADAWSLRAALESKEEDV